MTDGGFIVRAASGRDIGDMSELWSLAFGDGRELVEKLISEAGLLPLAVVAELGGRVRSVMFTFDGIRACGLKISYIYALCTHSGHRSLGMGGAVVRKTMRRAYARGADAVCLHPASESLSEWYMRLLGARVLGSAEYVPFQRVAGGGSVRAATPDEYAARRGGSGCSVPIGLLRAQELLCPGSLLLVSAGGSEYPVSADVADGVCRIHEAVCPPELKPAVLSAAAAHFSAGAAVSAEPCAGAPGGIPHLIGTTAAGKPFAGNIVLPFLLD